MRLAIDHRTTYRFTQPQGRLTQLLRLTPEDTLGQTVTNWHLHVDCDARMRLGRDGFGNRITMLYVEGPIAGIEIAVSGEVLTTPCSGVVEGAHEPLPPPLFLRTTPLTTAGAMLAGFAADTVRGIDAGGQAAAIAAALFARFTLDPSRLPVLSAGDAFARDAATPRSLAQMFVAAARSVGIPARYVSGYSPVSPAAEARPAPHGWGEAWIAGQGWVALDPATGSAANDAYVRVAVALDSAGAAPVAGTRLGDGHEDLDVDLQVGTPIP